MAYNDEAVLAKLSSLSETQDSIVSVAQWIMFYRYGIPMAVSKVVRMLRFELPRLLVWSC